MPTIQFRKEEENDELITVYNEIFKNIGHKSISSSWTIFDGLAVSRNLRGMHTTSPNPT